MLLSEKKIAIRLDKYLNDCLEDEAERKHITVSSLVREILAAHFAEERENGEKC